MWNPYRKSDKYRTKGKFRHHNSALPPLSLKTLRDRTPIFDLSGSLFNTTNQIAKSFIVDQFEMKGSLFHSSIRIPCHHLKICCSGLSNWVLYSMERVWWGVCTCSLSNIAIVLFYDPEYNLKGYLPRRNPPGLGSEKGNGPKDQQHYIKDATQSLAYNQ